MPFHILRLQNASLSQTHVTLRIPEPAHTAMFTSFPPFVTMQTEIVQRISYIIHWGTKLKFQTNALQIKNT